MSANERAVRRWAKVREQCAMKRKKQAAEVYAALERLMAQEMLDRYAREDDARARVQSLHEERRRSNWGWFRR